MNRFHIFIFAIVLMCGCHKKPAPINIVPDYQKNHLQRNRIFGDVKTINTSTFYVKNDSIPVSDTSNLRKITDSLQADLYATQVYSSDGFLTKYLKFNHLKDTILLRNYNYDNDANITSWEEYDSTGTCLTYGKTIFDMNKFVAGEQIFKNDSIAMSFTYKTDGVGNIIASTQNFGDYSTTVKNKYNENGLVVEITEYEPSGKMFKNAKIEYDNYGDEVNRCVYKSGNQMIEYTYTKYDQNGKIISSIYEDRIHNVKEFHYFFDFDKNKNWQTEVCAVDGQIIYIKQRNFTYYTDF